MAPETVWLVPQWNQGEPKEVEATPEVIVPMLVAGWSQCDPPASNTKEEVNPHVG